MRGKWAIDPGQTGPAWAGGPMAHFACSPRRSIRRWGLVRGGRPTDEVTTTDVARARDGDERAIEVIWRALQPALLRYLRSLGVEGAQDVASVVWIELAGALPKLSDDDPVSLRRMMFTIARRRMIDEFRRRERRGEVPTADNFEMSTDPDDSLANAIDLLRHLPPSQAEVIALRTIAGMSAQEVGEITGQTPAAVRVMAHRGLATLREILTDQGIGPDGLSTEAVSRMTHPRPDPVTNLGVASNNTVQ